MCRQSAARWGWGLLLPLLLPLLLLLLAVATSRGVDTNRRAELRRVALTSVAKIARMKRETKDPNVKFPDETNAGPLKALFTSFALKFDSRDVVFHLFTKSNESDLQGTVVTASKSSISSAGWNPGLPTRIVIHGFSDDITSPVVQQIKNAYLATGDYNVIGVDWGKLCPWPYYINSVANVKPTGQQVAKFIDVLLEEGLSKPSMIHVIGHSLGAHVAGIAAASARYGNVSRATGLDPALPLFELTPETDRLNRNDAEVVDVIHTSAGGLGFATPIGTVDFYPNGGVKQPGCGLDTLALEMCSHDRSFELFVESIFNNQAFPSAFATSFLNAENGVYIAAVTAMMGDNLQFTEPGSYYLTTGGSPPYNNT